MNSLDFASLPMLLWNLVSQCGRAGFIGISAGAYPSQPAIILHPEEDQCILVDPSARPVSSHFKLVPKKLSMERKLLCNILCMG